MTLDEYRHLHPKPKGQPVIVYEEGIRREWIAQSISFLKDRNSLNSDSESSLEFTIDKILDILEEMNNE